jgi:cytochrome c
MSIAPKIATAALACGLALGLASPAALASEALAQKYGCTGCHHAQRAGTGPSWDSIRDKVRDGSRTAAQIANTIRTGCMADGTPMSPEGPRVPEDDARRLADWILGAR